MPKEFPSEKKAKKYKEEYAAWEEKVRCASRQMVFQGAFQELKSGIRSVFDDMKFDNVGALPQEDKEKSNGFS